MFLTRDLTLAIPESMLVVFSLFCGDVMTPWNVDKRVRRAICCFWRVDLMRIQEVKDLLQRKR